MSYMQYVCFVSVHNLIMVQHIHFVLQIISVDKGLDRCAAVLQSLLAEGGKMMMMGR